MFKQVVILLGLMGVLNCTSGSQMMVDTVVTKKKVVKIEAVEVNDKIKRRKYDVKVFIENLHDNSIVMFLQETKCYKGKERGQISHAFFGIGERSIDLKLGQRKDFRFVCVFARPVAGGDFRLEFKRVFANPNNDGRTSGRLLAKDVVVRIKNSAGGGD